jgi:hypothetical protein
MAVLFGVLWGSGLGWLQPQHTSAYVPIIPRQQEAELMGLFLLSGQFLSWLSPAVFTAMNENHISMSYGLGSLSAYFALGLLCLLSMGSYEDALIAATTTHYYDADSIVDGSIDRNNQSEGHELFCTPGEDSFARSALSTSKPQEEYPLHNTEFT